MAQFSNNQLYLDINQTGIPTGLKTLDGMPMTQPPQVRPRNNLSRPTGNQTP
jgi:hypothetical protein